MGITIEEIKQEFINFIQNKSMRQWQPIYKKMNTYRSIFEQEFPFVPKDSHILQYLYHLKNNVYNLTKCTECSNKNTRFKSYHDGYYPQCSTRCSRKVGSKKLNKLQKEKDYHFKTSPKEFRIFIESKFPRPGLLPALVKALQYKDWNKMLGNTHLKCLEERIHLFLNNIKEPPICKCGKNISFQKSRKKYNKFCSTSCRAKNYHQNISKEDEQKRVKKQVNSYLKKYGVNENPEGRKKLNQKYKENSLKKWGTEHYLQSEKGVKQAQKSMLEKRGYKNGSQNPEVIEQIKNDPKTLPKMKSMQEAFQEKYGVSSPMKVDWIREKIENTCLKKYGSKTFAGTSEWERKTKKIWKEKYGEDNPWKDPKVQRKALINSGKLRKYTTVTGEIVKIRGYDGLGYDYLLSNGYKFENILYEYQGKHIPYKYKNKNHKYIPDFQFTNSNEIVEIKSTWTLLSNIEENLSKMNACINLKKDFKFCVFDHKEKYLFSASSNVLNENKSLYYEKDLSEILGNFLYTDKGLLFYEKQIHIIVKEIPENIKITSKVSKHFYELTINPNILTNQSTILFINSLNISH